MRSGGDGHVGVRVVGNADSASPTDSVSPKVAENSSVQWIDKDAHGFPKGVGNDQGREQE